MLNIQSISIGLRALRVWVQLWNGYLRVPYLDISAVLFGL